ncbi:hypothetical protein RRG08_046815 [Elysia crispata]|uniref:Uncharacterized protein n=1 Tax=Elysia crispata TaxID=231223 RepID=A0AAE1DIR1_9GAST|nr:hypothetical protein RRG08_046815 [Elysia crispata]
MAAVALLTAKRVHFRVCAVRALGNGVYQEQARSRPAEHPALVVGIMVVYSPVGRALTGPPGRGPIERRSFIERMFRTVYRFQSTYWPLDKLIIGTASVPTKVLLTSRSNRERVPSYECRPCDVSCFASQILCDEIRFLLTSDPQDLSESDPFLKN